MSEFLVLGLIPGTHFQITFVLWLLGATLLLLWVGVHFARRAHLFRNWLITTVLIVITRRQPGALQLTR